MKIVVIYYPPGETDNMNNRDIAEKLLELIEQARVEGLEQLNLPLQHPWELKVYEVD